MTRPSFWSAYEEYISSLSDEALKTETTSVMNAIIGAYRKAYDILDDKRTICYREWRKRGKEQEYLKTQKEVSEQWKNQKKLMTKHNTKEEKN
jgi:hypothetical protein